VCLSAPPANSSSGAAARAAEERHSVRGTLGRGRALSSYRLKGRMFEVTAGEDMMETSYVASWQSDGDVECLESLEDSSLVERSIIDVVTKSDRING
jgi:hypothetical protein